MISFTVLDSNNIREMTDSLAALYGDGEYIGEILESFIDPDREVGVGHGCGCRLVRLFDGGYSFVYPIPLSDDADELLAIDEIRLYAIKEEIPFRITDLPEDSLDAVSEKYLHVSVDYYDDEREAYEISVLNEACREDIPTIEFEGLTLDRLTSADDKLYTELCTDPDTNRFWGYDYRNDNPNPNEDYFRLECEGEFDRGVSIPFALRLGGDFVGEATLYAFDYLGGCQVAIRVLPKYRRMGVADRVLQAIKAHGGAIGLHYIRAEVMANNLPSVSLCKKHYESFTEEDGIYKFINKI